MLREFEISVKQGAPLQIIEEENFIKRWTDARKNGDEYIRTMCGTITTDCILSIMDRTRANKAFEKMHEQLKEMGLDEGKGIYVPKGTGVLPISPPTSGDIKEN